MLCVLCVAMPARSMTLGHEMGVARTGATYIYIAFLSFASYFSGLSVTLGYLGRKEASQLSRCGRPVTAYWWWWCEDVLPLSDDAPHLTLGFLWRGGFEYGMVPIVWGTTEVLLLVWLWCCTARDMGRGRSPARCTHTQRLALAFGFEKRHCRLAWLPPLPWPPHFSRDFLSHAWRAQQNLVSSSSVGPVCIQGSCLSDMAACTGWAGLAGLVCGYVPRCGVVFRNLFPVSRAGGSQRHLHAREQGQALLHIFVLVMVVVVVLPPLVSVQP
ncbi:hypothetical protein N658DRAFT_83479 [Parathielavia hyrcaniae]|uniref:Uncharacterized protein n=1 Tax=Parathielavia hyrcaniae TaxID=113614 RepID=A0AAN6Q4H5_9PEZI|nr:hypothetical protein N658DRAFT_83479 [Parathielavia hyrcaniae]